MGAGALVRRTFGLEVRADDGLEDGGQVEPEIVSYSEAAAIAAILHATGARADARALAAVEIAVGTWERAFAAASIAPASPRLAMFTPACLAMIGRALASLGEICFAIEVRDGALMLLPASTFDVAGSLDRWTYRLDMHGPSLTTTRVLPAESVLHFRIGVDARVPWRGRDPLRYAVATGRLASTVESALAADARIPTGRVVPVPGNQDQASQVADNLTRGGIVGIGAGIRAGGHSEPRAANWTPGRLGPAPPAELVDLRNGLSRAILASFGLSPALFEGSGDGAGQREAWRRAWAGTFTPVARIVAGEIADKLDVPGVMLQLDELRPAAYAARPHRALRARPARRRRTSRRKAREIARRPAAVCC